MTCFLIIHGEVEVGPGRFEPGVLSSRSCKDHADAEWQWQWLLERGLYDPEFEWHEVVDEPLTLVEALA